LLSAQADSARTANASPPPQRMTRRDRRGFRDTGDGRLSKASPRRRGRRPAHATRSPRPKADGPRPVASPTAPTAPDHGSTTVRGRAASRSPARGGERATADRIRAAGTRTIRARSGARTGRSEAGTATRARQPMNATGEVDHDVVGIIPRPRCGPEAGPSRRRRPAPGSAAAGPPTTAAAPCIQSREAAGAVDKGVLAEVGVSGHGAIMRSPSLALLSHTAHFLIDGPKVSFQYFRAILHFDKRSGTLISPAQQWSFNLHRSRSP
jgi:hypothetical protein